MAGKFCILLILWLLLLFYYFHFKNSLVAYPNPVVRLWYFYIWNGCQPLHFQSYTGHTQYKILVSALHWDCPSVLRGTCSCLSCNKIPKAQSTANCTKNMTCDVQQQMLWKGCSNCMELSYSQHQEVQSTRCLQESGEGNLLVSVLNTQLFNSLYRVL